MKTALVTGANGFIGRHLSATLEGAGVKVWPFDRIGAFGQLVVPHDLSGESSETYIQIAVKGIDAVFHLAGTADARAHETGSVMVDDITAARRVLRACGKEKKPLVVGSSAFAITRNTSYGVTKGCIEDLCTLANRSGQPVAVARLFNVYGPGQENAVTYRSAVVPGLIGRFSEGDFSIRSPQAKRDFIYIDDVAHSLIVLMELLEKGEGKPINEVGCGLLHTIWDLGGLILKEMRLPGPLVTESDVSPEVKPYNRAALPFERALVDLQTGVQRTVSHMRAKVAT